MKPERVANKGKGMGWQVGLAVVAWCWLASSLIGATIALIPGQELQAPAEEVFSQMETRLTSEPAFALVERDQPRRVLVEHQLGAAGYASPTNALQMGKWLPADLFVFVERFPGATNQMWRIQIVESRTGIALGYLEENGERLAKDPAPLVAKLKTTLQKWQVPPKDRHYVGVLGVQNEEINRALDSLAAFLEARIGTDLAAGSNVVVLDREHLEFLTLEQNLTGVATELRSSAILVQFSLKRIPDSTQVQAKLMLQHFDHRFTGASSIVLSTNNQTRMREQLARAVCDKIKVAAPALGGFDAEKEAAFFANRANTLHLDGNHEAAARAAEAAFALHPIPTHRLRAAELAIQVSAALAPSLGSPVSRDSFGRPQLAGGPKVQVLRHALRGAELYREGVELCLAESRRHPIATNSFPVLISQVGITRALSLPVEAGESEARLLRRELQQQCIALFRAERDYYAALWNCPSNLVSWQDHPQNKWEWLLSFAIERLPAWTDEVDEWARLLREVVGNYRTPPGPFNQSDRFDAQRSRPLFYDHLANTVPVQEFQSAKEREVILAVAESFSRDPDPALHLAGLNQIRKIYARIAGRSDPTRNREFLERFLREYPYNHPVRIQDNDYRFPAYIVADAVADPHAPDRMMIETQGRAILTPILQAKDGVRLCSWARLVLEWLKSLEADGKRAEALFRVQECLDLLPPTLITRDPQEVLRFRARLVSIHDRLAPRLNELTGEWAGWELVCLSSNAVPNADLAMARFQSNRLVTLWARQYSPQRATVHLMSQSWSNGNFSLIGKTDVQCNGPFVQYLRPSLPFTLHGDMAILGTKSGGLAIFRNGEARVFATENGLPTNEVSAVASLEGAVYIGFKHGLAILDPKSGKVTEISSSRSTEQRNPFDGKLFYPGAFLADPGRRCVWMAINPYGSGPQVNMRGLWKFTPADNKYELISQPFLSGIHLLTFQNGAIVAGSGWPDTPIFAVNPETGQATWLTETEEGRGSKTPIFGLVAERDRCWLWRGAELFTGGSLLSRRTVANQVPATLRQSPDGRSLRGNQNGKTDAILDLFEPLPGQIVFVNTQGEVWRLRQARPAVPVEQPSPESTKGMGFQAAPSK